jgi:hypothetical protein
MMFVGIGAERIEVSIADPEEQESVLRFIQAEAGKALTFSERSKVEVKIRSELAFRGLPALFDRCRQKVEAHSVVQPGEQADLRPDLGLRAGKDPETTGRSTRQERSGARLAHREDLGPRRYRGAFTRRNST